VLAPDFIGYGQSGAWPEGKVFTVQADLAVLLELAKETEEPIHLVGHSYGAALALEAARGLGSRASPWSSRLPSTCSAWSTAPNGPRSSSSASRC
jgi:pimeloyl-ACP methyl ester carboxylesterase